MLKELEDYLSHTAGKPQPTMLNVLGQIALLHFRKAQLKAEEQRKKPVRLATTLCSTTTPACGTRYWSGDLSSSTCKRSLSNSRIWLKSCTPRQPAESTCQQLHAGEVFHWVRFGLRSWNRSWSEPAMPHRVPTECSWWLRLRTCVQNSKLCRRENQSCSESLKTLAWAGKLPQTKQWRQLEV